MWAAPSLLRCFPEQQQHPATCPPQPVHEAAIKAEQYQLWVSLQQQSWLLLFVLSAVLWVMATGV
jgi:hypothetical protein